MKVSKKRVARAVEFRDVAMKIVRHFEPSPTPNVGVNVDCPSRGFGLAYMPMTTHGFDHYLNVGALNADGTGRTVMNIYWSERGDVHVSRFVPGPWEAALFAESMRKDLPSPADGEKAARARAEAAIAAEPVLTESGLRARCKRAGYRMQKSRQAMHLNNHGKFMLSDHRNVVVLGSAFDASLKDIQEYLSLQAS